mgnify:CR=1 FL=1
MEWKKSNISGSELEKQQQAYIKEALEMAKRSVAVHLDNAAIEAEKAAAEKAAAEKAAAEKAAAEKAAVEKAAAEKAAVEKAAAEKAAVEKAAVEKADAEKAAAEKAAAEKKEAEELTKYTGDNKNTECINESKTECCDESINNEDIIDIAELKRKKQEQTSIAPTQNNASSNPPNFNNYINNHNKAQCNCPNCQRKRAQH